MLEKYLLCFSVHNEYFSSIQSSFAEPLYLFASGISDIDLFVYFNRFNSNHFDANNL